MSSEAELLAAIYADPDDDEPRRVYADVLQERGDPRGELIVLQLRRAAGLASEREQEQERALLKRYVVAWLGALAPMLEYGGGLSSAWARCRTRFERGFLQTACIKQGPKPTEIDAAVADPTWATVEELRGYFRADVLASAPFRALRRLRGQATFAPEELRKIAARTKPLRIDRVPMLWSGPLPDLSRACPEAEASVQLTSDFEEKLPLLAACGLRRARIWTYRTQVDALEAALRAQPARFEQVVLESYRGRGHTPFEIVLVRGDDGHYRR